MTNSKKKADALDTTPVPATTRNQIIAEGSKPVKKRTDDRLRNYATVIYPDSCPENWREIISEWHVETLVSPLHDQDLNPTGERKKPHRHVQVMFDGKKSKDQVKELFDQIGGVGIEEVNSIRGMARYLCHLDNPEKHQYDIKDVLQFSGADYQSIINLPTDRYNCLRELLTFIESNQVKSFNKLLMWCSKYKEDWFRLLCDNSAYVIKEFLASQNYCVERHLVDLDSRWKLPGHKKTPREEEEEAQQLLSAPPTDDKEVSSDAS